MKKTIISSMIAFSLLVVSCENAQKSKEKKGDEVVKVESKLKDSKTVRLAVVNTPDYDGLMDALLPGFEKETGLKVQMYSGSDVHFRAMEGEADIVISHYGKSPVEDFVMEGWGTWPEMVFSNQAVIIGHKSDPAKIKGMENASEAFAKIAKSNSFYAESAIPGVAFLSEMLWGLAGNPEKGAWYQSKPSAQGNAAKLVDQNKGYFLWGSAPFLRYKEKTGADLEIMVSKDPMLQRIMAISIVKNERVNGVNTKGAELLRDYLLRADTQVKVAEYRSKWSDLQLWWPAARDN